MKTLRGSIAIGDYRPVSATCNRKKTNTVILNKINAVLLR